MRDSMKRLLYTVPGIGLLLTEGETVKMTSYALQPFLGKPLAELTEYGWPRPVRLGGLLEKREL